MRAIERRLASHSRLFRILFPHLTILVHEPPAHLYASVIVLEKSCITKHVRVRGPDTARTILTYDRRSIKAGAQEWRKDAWMDLSRWLRGRKGDNDSVYSDRLDFTKERNLDRSGSGSRISQIIIPWEMNAASPRTPTMSTAAIAAVSK